ncbi:hypothetical protein AAMO2058_001523900 [Amorphochlora amoebiformis]|mmetsp:Transcript_23042/g.36209  ORF Transcript_23042/g.36209 Transcript_23042/m.36209 type:complete len:186 (-) Transcript_23042:120-677(-)
MEDSDNLPRKTRLSNIHWDRMAVWAIVGASGGSFAGTTLALLRGFSARRAFVAYGLDFGLALPFYHVLAERIGYHRGGRKDILNNIASGSIVGWVLGSGKTFSGMGGGFPGSLRGSALCMSAGFVTKLASYFSQSEMEILSWRDIRTPKWFPFKYLGPNAAQNERKSTSGESEAGSAPDSKSTEA